MSMGPVTIECTDCNSLMRLSKSVLERVQGRTGKVTCKGCGKRIQLDRREVPLILRGAIFADEVEVELDDDPSPLQQTDSISLAPSAGSRPKKEDATLRREPAGTSSSGGGSLAPQTIEQSSALDEPADELRASPEIGSKDVAEVPDDEIESVRTERAQEIQGEQPSSPEAALPSSPLADPALDGLYQRLKKSRATQESAPAERPTPLPTRKAPRPSVAPPHAAVAPPRPWELDSQRFQQGEEDADELAKPAARLEADPSAAKGSAQGVQLTSDGRLVNAADKNKNTARKKSRRRMWLPAAAAAALLGGFVTGKIGTHLAGAQPVEASVPAISSVAHVVLANAEPTAVEPPTQESEPELSILPGYASAIEAPLEQASPDEEDEEASPDEEETELRQANEFPSDRVEDGAEPEDSTHLEEPSPKQEASTDSAESMEEDVEANGAEPTLPPFSKEAASAALNAATGNALSCRKGSDPIGTARVVVTFAPSGRATSATVNGFPFAGTEIGGCVARQFSAVRIPAFSGNHVTVRKKVVLQ